MVFLKRAFVLFVLWFFLTNAFALNLILPENVPEGTSFSAFAKISETGFDEIRVLLGDKVIFTQKLGVETNAEYVAYYKEYSPLGDKSLVLLLNPLKAGKYELEIRLLAANSTKSKDSVTFNVFKVASASNFDALNRDVSSLKSELNSLKSEINAVKDKTSSLETKLSNNEAEVSSLKNELQSLSKSLQDLEAEVDQLSTSLSSTNDSLNEQKASLSEAKAQYNDLNEQITVLTERVGKVEEKMEEKKTPAFGFLTLENSAIFLTLVLLVVAIFLALSIAKKKSKRRSLFETESHKDTSEVLEDVITEDVQAGGRWAYKGDQKEKEPEEKKRFSLGDLIRRK
ncbi:MAG: hypothetical protein N3F05_01500 [Candidatus Diapherotrites archaeon]|nr:hypothetical protein [Candidatus Diapherotrites archaeon]